MLYGENTCPIFHNSLCPFFCLSITGLTGEGIINFYVLILYFSVHFLKNAYFLTQLALAICKALCYIVQSSYIIYNSASGYQI